MHTDELQQRLKHPSLRSRTGSNHKDHEGEKKNGERLWNHR
jgi:hypothetical protein